MKFAALFIIVLSIVGCQMPSLEQQGHSIEVHASYLTIEWDPPTGILPGSPEYPILYKIYYSDFGKTDWTLLGIADSSDKPSFTLNHSYVGNGVYIFAVSAVTLGGGESLKHTSLDYTADPISGWYVMWMKND